jgi:mRNA interferase RelE/StbE
MYSVELSPAAYQQKRSLRKLVREQIEAVLDELATNPYTEKYDAQPMRGDLVRYRCVVGSYRIIYRIVDNNLWVYVLEIGHRGTIYDRK